MDAAAGAPQISGLTQDHGLPGASVIIAGSGFGVIQGSSTVKFGPTVAAVDSWSDTSIACRVPTTTAGSTTVSVTVGDLMSNALHFTVSAAQARLSLKGLHAGRLVLGRRVTATCRVTPAELAGGTGRITVQKKAGSRWVRVGGARWIDRRNDGAHSWKYKPAKRGDYRMRATVDGVPATSPWRKFKVRSANSLAGGLTPPATRVSVWRVRPALSATSCRPPSSRPSK